MKDKYLIKIEGNLIEVSEEIYNTYYKMERHERWLTEKDGRHGVVSLNIFDNEEKSGKGIFSDENIIVSELIETEILCEKLNQCLLQLNEDEKELISKLFYKEMTEREAAEFFKCSPSTLHYRKSKVLKKLKSMMKKIY